jgi:hypothetical protein
MSKPVLAVGLLAGMAGAWYWALLPPLTPAAPVRQAPARTAAAAEAVPAVGLERLATRGVPALPSAAGRDPFRGATASMAAPPTTARASSLRSAVPVSAPAAPTVPVWPRVELIGVAEGREGAALVRTAIVSGPQGVHHVRAGDVVEGVYRVERIAADSVDVRLVPEDRVVRLGLRP